MDREDVVLLLGDDWELEDIQSVVTADNAPAPRRSPCSLTRATGAAWSPDRFSYRVAKAAKAAGVKATSHTLRRSLGSRMAREGHNAKAIQVALGQSDLATTMSYYIHPGRTTCPSWPSCCPAAGAGPLRGEAASLAWRWRGHRETAEGRARLASGRGSTPGRANQRHGFDVNVTTSRSSGRVLCRGPGSAAGANGMAPVGWRPMFSSQIRWVSRPMRSNRSNT